MQKYTLGCTVLSALLTVLAPASFGSTVLVTSAGGLSGSDTFLISTIGGEGTTISSGYLGNTAHSNSVTFTDSGSNGFSVLRQGDLWSGNFAANALVLWTGNVNTVNADAVPLTLLFGSAVGGVGFQIQPTTYGTFTASIDAYDSGSTHIGSFTENGTSSPASDNSAIFLGVLSTSANIKSVTVNITVPSGNDYAIGNLTFGAPGTGGGSGVPEPSSLALSLCGAGIFLAYKFKGQAK